MSMIMVSLDQYVSRYYVTATIMRNAHVCLYGGISSEYFGCEPPTLESYFSIE
jgi:hypothetical protein